jgi:hypothetical protein
VRERHKQVEPGLKPVAGDPQHTAACLLEDATAAAIWARLNAGEQPDTVRAEVMGNGDKKQ